MQPTRTIELLKQYAELCDARERRHGKLPQAARDAEALASARAAMELAGHPVGDDVRLPAHVAV